MTAAATTLVIGGAQALNSHEQWVLVFWIETHCPLLRAFVPPIAITVAAAVMGLSCDHTSIHPRRKNIQSTANWSLFYIESEVLLVICRVSGTF